MAVSKLPPLTGCLRVLYVKITKNEFFSHRFAVVYPLVLRQSYLAPTGAP
jgi:hypothetical protein